MDPEDKRSLRENRVALVEDLEPQDVLDCLTEDGILTENDVELISNGKTRKERCQLLLSVLPKRGPSAYGSFQRALRAENVYPHLDTILRIHRKHYAKTSADISCLHGGTTVKTHVKMAQDEKDKLQTVEKVRNFEETMVMNSECGVDYGETHFKNVEKRRNVCHKCRRFVPKYSKKSQISQICRRHCCLLLENIEPVDILDLHIQEQILSDDDCERIRVGSTRKERCKTFLHCLANSHDDRVVSVLKNSLKKKYSYIVDTIDRITNKFDQSQSSEQMVEKSDDSTIPKQYLSLPNRDFSTRQTIQQQMQRNQDEMDHVKLILITDGRGHLKIQHDIGGKRRNSAFLDISVSTDTDEDVLPPQSIKKVSKTRLSTKPCTHCSHHHCTGLDSRESSVSSYITVQPGAIAPYELVSRRLVMTFNYLSTLINQGNFKKFVYLSSTFREKYHHEPDMLCLLGYLNASRELFKTNIDSAKKHVSSALEIVPRTSNPKYFTLELFTVKTRIYIMSKKMEKLQEIMDDAKMIIEADPVGCTGRAAGWLYVNEYRSIMIQTGMLNFRKKQTFDTYTWLHEKAKASLRKALTNFQEDGGRDGPFGFGYALCILVILLLRCGENGLTMGVLSPPNEDVIQAGTLLEQLENSEIPIPKILEVNYLVAKSDYQFRRGNTIRALEHARRAYDLAIELNVKEIGQYAYNRLVFLRTNTHIVITELNKKELDGIVFQESDTDL